MMKALGSCRRHLLGISRSALQTQSASVCTKEAVLLSSIRDIQNNTALYPTRQWSQATRAYTRTVDLCEKVAVKVPTMGDSITEGTIVEWTADVGQQVQEGDVVAMVETDKVTIDIKAEMAGVVVQHFGNVDDTVEVGANLYELDTDAEAARTIPSSTETESPPAPAITTQPEESTSQPAVATSSTSARVPSIQFLGKEGWAKRLSGQDAASTSAGGAASTAEDVDFGVDAVPLLPEDPTWDPMYGRPVLSDDEMEALLSGGANLAPTMIKPSVGAIFG